MYVVIIPIGSPTGSSWSGERFISHPSDRPSVAVWAVFVAGILFLLAAVATLRKPSTDE